MSRAALVRQQRRLRRSEAAFIVLAAGIGLAAGVITMLQQWLAHGLQRAIYGVSINRLSALGSIHHSWKLLALPLGGVLLILFSRAVRRRPHAPIDVVEANALHGGRIPFADNLIIAVQTILSNGAGASVGLEAAYAQMGGGVASWFGSLLKLRRSDLRALVGAGAGSAIGAAFGAPLTGAFYAFEIVIGNYTPAAIAPVVAASLAAVLVTRTLGVEPYLIATATGRAFPLLDYLAFSALGLICALLGIVVMRLVSFVELRVQGWRTIAPWRPVVGGLILIPLALASPQTLSAGHGALHLDLALRPPVAFLLAVLALKIAASVVSLGFGFRGGLFFASLFLGTLVGQLFAALVNLTSSGAVIDPQDAALVGMAALSVSVVGGPMTMAILMLEITHDFSLMGIVLAATLVSSAVTRETFGYSFSTWRLHLRGSRIRSPRDIGWRWSLDADRLMRRDWTAVRTGESVASFRTRVPLGSTSKAVLVDGAGRYDGIVSTAAAHASDLDPTTAIDGLAMHRDTALERGTSIDQILRMFDDLGADELAVVDGDSRVVGVVTERHARRRFFEEVETRQREVYGEV